MTPFTGEYELYGPSLNVWNKLKEVGNNQKSDVDISRLITSAEKLELEF